MSVSPFATPYVVTVKVPYRCVWCSSYNDAQTAPLCSCVTSERTLTCSTCNRCFCEAPSAWRTAFLSSPAATAFLSRRRSERPKGTGHLSDVTGPLRRPVILVVDDDKIVHVIARRVLADCAGTVIHATDGDEALELAQKFLPELVITDALLPKLDGRELALRLKSSPETSNCKVAVMSALYKGQRYRNEAILKFRADEYLEKPVTADALRSIASSLLPSPMERSAG